MRPITQEVNQSAVLPKKAASRGLSYFACNRVQSGLCGPLASRFRAEGIIERVRERAAFPKYPASARNARPPVIFLKYAIGFKISACVFSHAREFVRSQVWCCTLNASRRCSRATCESRMRLGLGGVRPTLRGNNAARYFPSGNT